VVAVAHPLDPHVRRVGEDAKQVRAPVAETHDGDPQDVLLGPCETTVLAHASAPGCTSIRAGRLSNSSSARATAASLRELTLSLENAAERWLLTVLVARNSSRPISSLVRPVTARSSTWRSR